MKKEFWKDWKYTTKIEEIAIKSVKKAKRILFSNISKDKIYAIYIKGSFVRREMNNESDIDIVPITYDNKTLEKIKELEETKSHLYKPAELLPRSLKEFEQMQRHIKSRKPKGGIDIFLRNIHKYKLIYGKKIDISKYRIRSDEDFLKGHIIAFRTIFIPAYKQKEFSFSEVVKQIFFLVEREVRLTGKEPPNSWKALARSIKNKNHIIHDALRFRLHPTKDPKLRAKLLVKLEKYLDKLRKKLKNLVKH